MSAESSCTPSQLGAHVIAPQPVSDRSIIESVAGFINDVVPQGYSSVGPVSENKELITWARFEFGDINDPALYPDTSDDRNGTAPLLLVLGYGNGVQVWAIPASGEATEVLSWRQGVVRTLRVLPTPPSSPSGQHDMFAQKRPLVALCDSTAPGPQFCSLSFISLRGGDQVKSIKFKNSVNDVLANRTSVVVSFHERIAVFDAWTLEDRMTITTCYPCPGPNPNPVALGARWMAYAERRLIPSKRCSGGTEGEGIQSYTATVLHAAKSLGKGLRELGETVASSLTGGVTPPGSRSLGSNMVGQSDGDVLHPGIVTVVDAQGTWKENGRMEDNVIAHFTAHGEAIVALQFDPSGMLLVTADKRGHDFHLFRIQPHPGGSPLAAVHHLYVLHRGDTTAKVQDIAFAGDSRWVAVSTLRGTTHVFPVTPYGGAVGLRTHSTPHVVNRLSRFHRSAGLTADGRNSPQPNTQQQQAVESQSGSQAMPYSNPRLPPYPHPTVVMPLAQIRQPVMHLAAPSSPVPSNQGVGYHRNPSVKALGRNQSSSEESGGIPLRVSACFAPSRAWLVGSPTMARDSSARSNKKAVDSLFVMACHGNLIEYDLETKHASGIPKEKICDDTPIELEVVAKAQWLLLRPPQSSQVQPPLPHSNPLMVIPSGPPGYPRDPTAGLTEPGSVCDDERWLSHVEIVTHAGPHRRLWMGPQFTFKTYSASASVCSSLLECESVDIASDSRLARSNPVNMPLSNAARQSPIVPFLIESGSGGSLDQSPHLLEVYGAARDGNVGPGETQLREELADAMMESAGAPTRETGRRVIVELQDGKRSQAGVPIEKIVNPLGTVLTVVTDEGAGDGRALDGEPIDMTVRWPTDVVKVTSKLNQVHVTRKHAKVQPTPVEICSASVETYVEGTLMKTRDKITAPAVQVLSDVTEVLAPKKRGKTPAQVAEVIADPVEVTSVKKRGKSTAQVAEIVADEITASKLPSSKEGNEIGTKRRDNIRRAAAKEGTERKVQLSGGNVLQDADKPSTLLITKEKVLPVSVPLGEVEALPSQENEDKVIKKKDFKSNRVRDVKSQDRSIASHVDEAHENFKEKHQSDSIEKKEVISQDMDLILPEKKRQSRVAKLSKLTSNVDNPVVVATPVEDELLNGIGCLTSKKSMQYQIQAPIEVSPEIISDQCFRPSEILTSSIVVDQEDSFESVAESFGDCVDVENFSLPASCFQHSDQMPTATSSAWSSDVGTAEGVPKSIKDTSINETVVFKVGEKVRPPLVANGNVGLSDELPVKLQCNSDSNPSIDYAFMSTSMTAPIDVSNVTLKPKSECVAIEQLPSGVEMLKPEVKLGTKAKTVSAKEGKKSKNNTPGLSVAIVAAASLERGSSLGPEPEFDKQEVAKSASARKAKKNDSKLCPSAVSVELSSTTAGIELDIDMEVTAVNTSLTSRNNPAIEDSSTSLNVSKTVSRTIFEPFVKAEDAVLDCDDEQMQNATVDDSSQLCVDVAECAESVMSNSSRCEEPKKTVSNAWGSKARTSPKKRTSNGNTGSEPDDASLLNPVKEMDKFASISSLESIRLSPQKSWSSIASGKTKSEKQPSPQRDNNDLITSIRRSPDPPDTKLATELETVCVASPDNGTSQAESGSGIASETVCSGERLVQVESLANEEEINNESETQSLQAIKKNKKKNKKRR